MQPRAFEFNADLVLQCLVLPILRVTLRPTQTCLSNSRLKIVLQILSTSTARFKYCGSALSLIQISHMRCELCLSHFLRDSKPFCFKELEGICETQRNDGSWIEKSQELKKLKSNLRIPSALHISFAPFTLEEKKSNLCS